MSLQAAEGPRSGQGLVGRVWRFGALDKPALRIVLMVVAALGATYVAMCLKAVATGIAAFGYADFHALWVSGVLAHDGAPLVNYDSAALHAKQVLLGIDPHRDNPFPYPPTLLLLLAPLGALPLPVAFWLFMAASAAAFVGAMIAGRARDPLPWIAALAAPATGITIVSGQSGLLSAALMVGGFRLASTRPWLAGVLVGLLTFKPQLGVLVAVALVAAGMWQVMLGAVATAMISALISSLAFGWAIWPAWLHQLASYAGDYDVAVALMPTIFANLKGAGASEASAVAAQTIVALAVAMTVWRAFRSGVTDQAIALLVVGTFLATPHAFNYDMPMTSAAFAAYAIAARGSDRKIPPGEVAIVLVAFLTPFLILASRGALMPFSWTPLAGFFVLLARPRMGNPPLKV